MYEQNSSKFKLIPKPMHKHFIFLGVDYNLCANYLPFCAQLEAKLKTRIFLGIVILIIDEIQRKSKFFHFYTRWFTANRFKE
jgi:hypothetical protein